MNGLQHALPQEERVVRSVLARSVSPVRFEGLNESVDLVSGVHLGIRGNVDDVTLKDQGGEFSRHFLRLPARSHEEHGDRLVDL